MKKDKIKKFALAVPVTVMTAMPVLASETPTVDTVASTMVTTVQSIASSAMSAIGQILPVAAPVYGALVVISIGIRTFRKFGGKQ